MKTTSYICDKCKKSVSQSDLITLAMEVTNLKFENASGYNRTRAEVDICRDCLEKKGFVIIAKDKETADKAHSTNQKTIENKLIEILEDLGVSFCE